RPRRWAARRTPCGRGGGSWGSPAPCRRGGPRGPRTDEARGVSPQMKLRPGRTPRGVILRSRPALAPPASDRLRARDGGALCQGVGAAGHLLQFALADQLLPDRGGELVGRADGGDLRRPPAQWAGADARLATPARPLSGCVRCQDEEE